MKSQYEEAIKLEALSLDYGDTLNTTCPVCDVRTSKTHLSVSRMATGILYHCYRDSCGIKGFVESLPSNLSRDKTTKSFTPRKFTKPVENITTQMRNKLKIKYDLSYEEIHYNGIKSIKDRDGILLPLYNWMGYNYGHTTKYFDGLKTIHYLESETSKLHFPHRNSFVKDDDTIVLVEDVISAIRCARHAHSASLLGTNLTSAMVEDIIKAEYINVIIALDPDATTKAMKLKNKYGLFFKSFRAAPLSADPKDMNDTQLKLELGLSC